MSTTKSIAYLFYRGLNTRYFNISKGDVIIDSDHRAGMGTFKASKDFARGNTVPNTLFLFQ